MTDYEILQEMSWKVSRLIALESTFCGDSMSVCGITTKTPVDAVDAAKVEFAAVANRIAVLLGQLAVVDKMGLPKVVVEEPIEEELEP